MNDAAMRSYAKRRRGEFREWLAEQKRSCAVCGEADHRCLLFHHRDAATKRFQISLNCWSRSQDEVLSEIAKCDVLCANCHQKLHYRRE